MWQIFNIEIEVKENEWEIESYKDIFEGSHPWSSSLCCHPSYLVGGNRSSNKIFFSFETCGLVFRIREVDNFLEIKMEGIKREIKILL